MPPVDWLALVGWAAIVAGAFLAWLSIALLVALWIGPLLRRRQPPE